MEIVGTNRKHKNPDKFVQYSSNKKYLCGAREAFEECSCDMFSPAHGNRKFRIKSVEDKDEASSVDVWLCANCQQLFDLLDKDEERNLVPPNNNYIEVPLTTGDNQTIARICKGSCIDLAQELSSNDHIIIRVEEPPTCEEMSDLARIRILFPVEREGNRRGSKHFSSKQGSFEAVYKTLMECPNVKKVWLKIMAADDSRFYYIIPVYYKDETATVSFVPHVDRNYPGKPEKRSN